MTNSRAKGQRGELEFAALMKELWGVEARRGQQFRGSKDSPDVIHNLDGVHVEVKSTGPGSSPWAAMKQAERDGGPWMIPMVALKKNLCGWVLVIRPADLLPLAKRIKERKKP